MVVTRSQQREDTRDKSATQVTTGAPPPVVGEQPTPAEPRDQPPSTSGERPMARLVRSNPSIKASPSSFSSSITIKARKLKLEAQHARSLAELQRAQLELEQRTQEIELQAKLAALEAEETNSRASRRSSTAHSAVSEWLKEAELQEHTTPFPETPTPTHRHPASCTSDSHIYRRAPPSEYNQHDATERSIVGRHHSRRIFPEHLTHRAPSEPCAGCGRHTEPGAGAEAYFDGLRATRETRADQRARTDGDANIVNSIVLDCNTHAANKAHTTTDTQIKDALDTHMTQLAREIITASRNTQPRPKTWNIKLPSFDGNCMDWLVFKRAFEDTKGAYSCAENIARLSYALRGKARESSKMLLVAAQKPEDVMEALELTFARPELIVLRELTSVRTLPKMSTEEKDLNTFACRVRNCVSTVKFLEQGGYLEAPELLNCLTGKLTPLLRIRWADFASAMSETRKNLGSLSQFLDKEVALLARFGFTSEPPLLAGKVKERVNVASTGRLPQEGCPFCKKNHKLADCQQFKDLTVDDRWKFVKEYKTCHRCLLKGSHRYKICNAKSLCKQTGCKYRHHELLHNHVKDSIHTTSESIPESTAIEPNRTSAPQNEQPAEIPMSITGEATYASSTTAAQSSLRPLLKVIAVTVSGPTGSVDSYALLDDGSTATMVDSDLAKSIGANGPEGVIQVDCIGGLSKETRIRYVNFEIKGRYSDRTYVIEGARSITGLGIARQTVQTEDIRKYAHLADLADVLCYENAKPMIIIGTDYWNLSLAQSVRKGTRTQPVAIRTALGWVLFGFSCSKSKVVQFVNHAEVDDNTTLESLIREHYKLDTIGIIKKEVRSANDERALKILKNTVRRLPSGCFESGLLWKADISKVPDSYHLALSRFKSLEIKMSRDKNYADLYKQNINAMLTKNYAEEWDKPPKPSAVCWYLPHFGVTHPHKPGKLRVVHDAAAKTQGVSLNSLILPGPDLLQPLLNILFRFREGRVAITADIREMFPQIKIREEDRDAQRYLWRDSPDLPIKVYRMTSMMFGSASSPCTAIHIKNRNAIEFQDKYPEAAKAIIFDHYMDDYISSTDCPEDAARLAVDIIEVHRLAGFEMRSWISNNSTVLAQIPKELLLDPKTSVDLGDFHQNIRALGLIWQPTSDIIKFNTDYAPKDLPDKLTKRVVLSQLMRVFDPIGFLAPLIVRGRVLFQQIWRSGLDWDVELSQVQSSQWRDWSKDLSSVTQLQIPRWYSCDLNPVIRELHIFSDASELAFCAVAYWRFVFKNGNVKLAFVGSKVRVTPLKPVSIPRLELQGALVAARLAVTICEAHNKKPDRRIFWCDSMTVLGWLRSDARSYKPFVAHRISEILDSTNVSEWRWVPSVLNVADDATRLNPGGLPYDSRWISGPEFLHSTNDWPPEHQSDRQSFCEAELKPQNQIHIYYDTVEEPFLPLSADPTRFSKWLRLVRTTARAHQYIRILKTRILKKQGLNSDSITWLPGRICTLSTPAASHPSTSGERRRATSSSNLFTLTAENLNTAESHLLRQSQLDTFGSEINLLNASKPLLRNSRLITLSPYLEKDGLLRLSGRVSEADVFEQMKRPIILDGKHLTARLLLHEHHCRAAHGNNETIVNNLRQRYWVLKLRSSIKTVAKNCQFCRIRRSITPLNPPMGDLPDARLAHHRRPFTYVGLDYFGPVLVTIGRRSEKRYVALYTCMTSRAIHLEVVNSLSADSAIMSLRRFIARRGHPTQILSDNGTSFVGANTVLRQLYEKPVEEFSANRGIHWKFIPPAAPFMGGAWERLVRSVKVALKATLDQRSLKEEVLITTLAEAESLINSRPLTYVPVEPTSEESLTPFHFLLGSPSGEVLPVLTSDTDLLRRCDWRKAVRLSDHFWNRWVAEYLPTLLPRRRGKTSSTNLVMGDLVLIVDKNLPRGTWPRGRVVALHPGKDKVVRVVDVKTAAGVLRRPSAKLVKLVVE